MFEASEIPSDFAFFRTQRVEITANESEGYYVPESALQQKDGVSGVYILKDGIVRFRRIEILYFGDGYYIVSEHFERKSEYAAMKLNDLVIINDTKLYEGKFID